jgi:hypothetical protein
MYKPRKFEEVFNEAYEYWVDDSDPLVHEGAKGLADQIWQYQQAKVEQLKGQLKSAGYTDNGGELMKPPLGKPPTFIMLNERPICKKRARKLRKRAGVSVYWSKHLKCFVWVKN